MAFGHGGTDYGTAAAAGVGDRGGFGAVVVTVGAGVCRVLGNGLLRADDRDATGGGGGAVVGDRVQLRVQPADVIEGLPQGHFDTVVLNSVVQYFPSAGYLVDVIGNGVGCWRRAEHCSSGTCVITADEERVSDRRLRWPARSPAPTAAGCANGCSARCSASTSCCWRRSSSPAGPPTIPTWPGSTSNSNADAAVNELNRYRYEVIVHKTPAPVRSLATAPTGAVDGVARACADCGIPVDGPNVRPRSRVDRDPPCGTDHRRPPRTRAGRGRPVADALAQAAATGDPRRGDRRTIAPASAKASDTTSR